MVKLKALGFKNVHIETYMMPVWVRGEETAEIVGPYPQKLTLAALGRSGATPAEGITAPVVYFPTFNDLLAAPDGSLTGKIAFVSNQMKAAQDGSGYGAYGAARFIGPNVAAKKGAAAIVIKSIGSDKGRWPHTGGTNFAPGVTPIPAAALSVADAEQLERIFKRTDKVTLQLALTPAHAARCRIGQRRRRSAGHRPQGRDDRDRRAPRQLGSRHRCDRRRRRRRDHHRGGQAAARRPAPAPHDPRRLVRRGGTRRVRRRGLCQGTRGREVRDGGRMRFRRRQYLALRGQFPDSAEGDRRPARRRRSRRSASCAGREKAGDGTDVGPLFALGASAVDLNQNGTRYFDWHHTPEDTLDKIDLEQLRQNVAAWTTMLWIVANAPEDWDKATPKGG